MAATTDPHSSESFRLGMLLYDTRYRSVTIQIIALVLFMLALGWLVSNTISNLEALGKTFGFGFLWTPAGYDINQQLIEYQNTDSNARAAMLGILNTLLIAVMGCVTATLLGVVAGVLRLSNNWVVARLMTIYVEGFRNVPVLIWILIFAAAINESLPAPNAFRGDDAESSMVLGSMAFTNRGFYVPEPLFSRSLGTLDIGGYFGISLDLVLFVAALAAGIWGAKRLGAQATRKQAATGERPHTFWPSVGLIVIPPVVVLVALGFHLGYPELRGFNFRGGIHMRDSLIALWLALSLYTGAFIAEIVRAGILAVSRGQTEAASALGMRPSWTMRLIILPQAMRIIIPPLISNYLNLTKNSSLAIAVGYMDATGTLGGITLNQTGREMECLLLLMAFYLIVSLTISVFMNIYNERMKLKER
ncbi:amino acid ABC transporter permease [Oceanicella sp. SM1341]|uniref:amino acid ABC transporter permease n=1 Tax=Oceanicella sp. SM1341 TaxID=1548889 RepID=UPI000E488DB6|nr:ABC transporter permease subunit [Oceanicella sp. SM1341]